MPDKMLNIISLGAGVQSTGLYFMSCLGVLPRADYAIFADTGREKTGTIKYLKWLQTWQKLNDGIPIIVVREKNLFKDLLNSINSSGGRFSSIPAYTKNADGTVGMLQRQCSSEYKIQQVDNYIRDHIYNLPKGARRPRTRVWKGISFDELTRMSMPPQAWKIEVYPYCGWETFSVKGNGKAERMADDSEFKFIASRQKIIDWMISMGLPIPPKSSCVFCPYLSERAWYEMKTNQPSDFYSAVLIDRAIRNSAKKGIEQPIYLHESCIPLEEVIFTADAPDLFHGECSGSCHT